MKSGEYILYLIIGGFYGLLPLICLFAGLVKINYPSVICAVISVIFMAALFLFRGRSTTAEIERRFRLICGGGLSFIYSAFAEFLRIIS